MTGSKSVGATFTDTATCTGGKIIIGGGALLTQGNGGTPTVAAVSESYASTTGANGIWTAGMTIAIAGNGGSATPTVQAFAICGNP